MKGIWREHHGQWLKKGKVSLKEQGRPLEISRRRADLGHLFSEKLRNRHRWWLTWYFLFSCGSPEAGGDIQCRAPGCYHHHLHWVSADAIARGVGWNYPEIHQQPEGKEEWGACGWPHRFQCAPEKQKQGQWGGVYTTGLRRNTFWMHVYVYSVNIIKFSHYLYTHTTLLTLIWISHMWNNANNKSLHLYAYQGTGVNNHNKIFY